jgi:hypothetical protein
MSGVYESFLFAFAQFDYLPIPNFIDTREAVDELPSYDSFEPFSEDA